MNSRKNSSSHPLKTKAKALRKYLAEQGIELGHGKCLEAVARQHGYRTWDVASTKVVVPELPPHWGVVEIRGEDGGFEANWGAEHHDTFETREEAVEYARQTWGEASGLLWSEYVALMSGRISETPTHLRDPVFGEIGGERERQDRKWGGPSHDDEHSTNDFVAYINQHAGKAVDAPLSDQRTQMIKVAALAVAVVEKIDRQVEEGLKPSPLSGYGVASAFNTPECEGKKVCRVLLSARRHKDLGTWGRSCWDEESLRAGVFGQVWGATVEIQEMSDNELILVDDEETRYRFTITPDGGTVPVV